MSMEVTAWTSLHHAMNAQDERPLSRATLKRIAQFARPHRGLDRQVPGVECGDGGPRGGGARCWPAGWSTRSWTAPTAASVIRLAVLIAVIALAEAGLGLVTRLLSASIGEGLILDLRTGRLRPRAAHADRVLHPHPHGALVSRLNNDVIGAQRAFTDTLSGVVGNAVTLVLTLAVMLDLLLADHAAGAGAAARSSCSRPAGWARRLAELQREAAEHNAAMSTQMTERFSAPGATLVKLFGRPAEESAEFAARAGRVRDIGVRTAMLQWVFITALTLVVGAGAGPGLRAGRRLRPAGQPRRRRRWSPSRCC